jgi:hypothetical protein
MAILEQVEAKAFLGEEFLSWLLWRSETRNGLIGVREHEVQFGGSLTLSAPFGDAEEVTLKGENPGGAHELHSALQEGPRSNRARPTSPGSSAAWSSSTSSPACWTRSSPRSWRCA